MRSAVFLQSFSILSYEEMTYTTSSASSTALLSSPVVRGHDNASPASCLVPARWTTSKSVIGHQKHNYTSLSFAHARFSILFSASWSVCLVRRVPSRYGRRSSTAQTKVRRSWWVVSYARSTFFSDCDQYPMVFRVHQDASGWVRIRSVRLLRQYQAYRRLAIMEGQELVMRWASTVTYATALAPRQIIPGSWMIRSFAVCGWGLLLSMPNLLRID